MPNLPKVLIVDDDEIMQELYEDMLGDVASVVPAVTVEEARRLYLENPDVALIVMDGRVRSIDGGPTTLPLVRELRESFKGYMIAASGSSEIRDDLLVAGCSHAAEKIKVPDLVRALLAAKS